MWKLVILLVVVCLVGTSYSQLLNCEMTRQTVFDLIGSKKIEKRPYELSNGTTDTIYKVYDIKLGAIQRSVKNKSDNGYTKEEIGGWVGNYSGLQFKDDSLFSYSWGIELNDTCMLNQAKYEILFYMNQYRFPIYRIYGSTNPPKPKMGIIGGAGFKPATIVWYDGMTAYKLTLGKGISLHISKGKPQDMDEM